MNERMTNQEAIKAIRDNYPPSQYSMLREALEIAIEALETNNNLKVALTVAVAERDEQKARADYNAALERKRCDEFATEYRKVEKLKAALTIYADENHYVDTIGSMSITPTAMHDKGRIARDSLATL